MRARRRGRRRDGRAARARRGGQDGGERGQARARGRGRAGLHGTGSVGATVPSPQPPTRRTATGTIGAMTAARTRPAHRRRRRPDVRARADSHSRADARRRHGGRHPRARRAAPPAGRHRRHVRVGGGDHAGPRPRLADDPPGPRSPAGCRERVTKTTWGTGLRSPYAMQYAIELTGAPRIARSPASPTCRAAARQEGLVLPRRRPQRPDDGRRAHDGHRRVLRDAASRRRTTRRARRGRSRPRPATTSRSATSTTSTRRGAWRARCRRTASGCSSAASTTTRSARPTSRRRSGSGARAPAIADGPRFPAGAGA